ncbi:MAG: glycosyltransferase family 4 protein [Candidatus Kerfeldbacteria bacterium]|nr:glycosyltransferase family 4 protein [Candidatus Kerfeldbacteria bacterium]
MTVTFLTFGPFETASTRYRVLQFLPYLELDGIHCRTVLYLGHHRSLNNLAKGWYLVRAFVLSLRADVVFIQKILLPSWFLKILRLISKRIVYGVDDAMWLPGPNVAGFSREIVQKREKKFIAVVKNVHEVIVGNNDLKLFVQKYQPRVHLVPTCIDDSHYPQEQKPLPKRFCVGWIGSSANFPYLQNLENVFEILFQKYGEEVYLKIISDQPFVSTSGIEIKTVKWNSETEMREMQEFSVGLMPLLDSEWARGKCGFKALQYMALGIVPVASPVGVNTRIIQDGKTGFLPQTLDQWLHALETLKKSTTLQKEMGDQAREFFRSHYSLPVVYPLLKKIIDRS